MGFFSWNTGDTNEPIMNVYTRQHFPVYVVMPDDSYILEPAYEGYGVFGGRDFFALVAEINSPEVKAEYDRVRLEVEEKLKDLPDADPKFRDLFRNELLMQEFAELDEGFRSVGYRLEDIEGTVFPRFARRLKPWKELSDPEYDRKQGYFHGNWEAYGRV